MKCQHCGTVVADAQARFCPECGQRLTPVSQPVTPPAAPAPRPQNEFRPAQPPVNKPVQPPVNKPVQPPVSKPAQPPVNRSVPAYNPVGQAGDNSYQEYRKKAQPYQTPGQSYQAPGQGYQAPSQGYQPTKHGYQAPGQSYQSGQGYQAPSQGYQAPAQGYQSYQQPQGGYPIPPTQPKKKSNAWIFIVLAIVLVVFLVGMILIGSFVVKVLRAGELPFGQEEETVASDFDGLFPDREKDSGFLGGLVGKIFGSDDAEEVWPQDGFYDEGYALPDEEDWSDYEEPFQEEEPILMPDCVGMNVENAISMLEELGCYVLVEYQYTEDYDLDDVYQQSIVSGTQLYGGEKVTLLVSQGVDVCPYEYSQKVKVTTPYGSSYGTLTLYNWENGDWQEQFSCSVTVGKNGISTNYGEGKGYSPEGIFKLGIALSANSISNDTWPFRQVSSSTCVVDDVDSYYYNTIQNKNDLPSGTSYDSVGRKLTNGTNNILIYIEHNGDGLSPDNVVPGKGSVITLCGCSSSIKPTLGCVDISTYDMNTLISLLDYECNPHIELIHE